MVIDMNNSTALAKPMRVPRIRSSSGSTTSSVSGSGARIVSISDGSRPASTAACDAD